MHRTNRLAWVLAVMAVVIARPSVAPAQFSIEQGASILVFPNVVVDTAADTVIQIVNQSTAPVHARCLYVNGVGSSSVSAAASATPSADFQIMLTKLQPTHWVASRGRAVDPNDNLCSGFPTFNGDCDGAGFDPGPVPGLSSGFHGQLLCIETDTVGDPTSGNDLIGKATVQDLTSGDLANYNAIGLAGLPTNNGDDVLCLGGNPSDTCPSGAEYVACPQTWILSHLAEGTEDPIAGSGSTAATSLTLVPCSQDFLNQTSRPLTLEFMTTNELEQTFSTSTTVQGWAELPFAAISPMFEHGALGTDYLQTRISPGASSGGFMLVARTLRQTNGADMLATSTALNLHIEGSETTAETIVLPTPSAQ